MTGAEKILSVKKNSALSLIVSLIIFFALTYSFFGAPVNASVLERLNPFSSFMGVAFVYGWGFGVSNPLAYFFAALTLLVVFFCLLFFFRWFFAKLRK